MSNDMSIQFELFHLEKITKYSFSGHGNFYCRNLWLKKAYDFLKEGGEFCNKDALLRLGVGHSMVNSIKFWASAFGITQEDGVISELGEFLFSEEGADPYLEDLNSLWLLHYHLVKKGKASIYQLFFNDIKDGRRELSECKIKRDLLYKIAKDKQTMPSDIVLINDIRVLKNTYLANKKSENIEDDFMGLLHDLNLFETNITKKIIIENSEKNSISEEVFLYSILDCFKSRNSISVEEIISEKNSPGVVFCMSEEGVLIKLKKTVEKFSDIVLTKNAGVRELQLLKDFDKFEILNKYYSNKS